MASPITGLQAAQGALEGALANARRAIVLTGAGVSTQSGIPDFRSPGGIWSKMTPITYDEFVASETARLTDWERRFDMAERFSGATPNAAHIAMARLAQDGPVDLVVTQNIDGLHRRAGLPEERLVEIHGTGDHALCLDCGLRHEIEEARLAIEATGRAPRCRGCGGLVKAAIISFGQAMPEAAMRRAETAARGCDLFIAAGTSLVVYPVAGLTLVAKAAGARLVIASTAPTEQDDVADILIRTPLSETFAPWAGTI